MSEYLQVLVESPNIQKYIGTSNETNQKPLKKLRPKHLRVIALHMQGMTGPQIVDYLAQADVSIALMTVYKVLNDPLSKGLMNEFYTGAEDELKALDGMAVDVLRRAMRDGSHRDAISAADKVFKINKRYGESGSGSDGAENVIRRAMDAVLSANETVREVVRERPRLTDITPNKIVEGAVS